MSFKRKYKNLSERFSGKAKEVAGKVTGDQKLELQGKMQTAKADLLDQISVEKRVDDLTESIAGQINDKLDGKRQAKKRS